MKPNQLSNNIILTNFITQIDRSIVFIDSNVEDCQTLATGVTPDTEVVILDPSKNGIEQISQVLNQKRFTSVHIVSHGSPGSLYLGNTQLNLDNLEEYTSQLQNWFYTSLNKGWDLLLYGCNVTAGDAGEEFITKLHNLTGAQIAASTTRIGHAAKGGNWNLDYQTSKFSSKLAFNQNTKQNYAGIFAEEDRNPLVSDLTKNLSKEITADIASVTTDLNDYPPGSTAIITGENFNPGETVELQVLHTDDIPNTGGGHEPWQVTDGGAGDLDGVVDGNFETTWYVNPDDSANSAFEVTATGLSSREIATNTFTDSVIFSDNFDGTTTGWTVNPSGTDNVTTTATGVWKIGLSTQNINRTSFGNSQLQAVSASKILLTGLATATDGTDNTDIDRTIGTGTDAVTTVNSPTFALPSFSGSTNLSLNYYFATNDTSALAGTDSLTVKLIKASDATTLSTLLTVAPNAGTSAAWTTLNSSLNSFAGQRVYLQLAATDASNNSVVEAGIDNVSVSFTPANNIYGTVFKDYDNDGILDNSAGLIADRSVTGTTQERGIGGVTVKAYDPNGNLVATTTTSTSFATLGEYSLNTSSSSFTDFRLEFTAPTNFEPGGDSSGTGSLIKFVDTGTVGGEVTANTALSIPQQYYSSTSQPNPFAAITCFVYGAYNGTYASSNAIVAFGYNNTGTTPTPVQVATQQEVGSTLGIAFDSNPRGTSSAGTIYAASYTKRHTGYGANGAGVIYKISVNTLNSPTATSFGTPSVFVDLNNILGSGTVAAASRTGSTNYLVDGDAFANVGKTSFGDIEIIGDTMYVVELSKKRLYAIPLDETPTNSNIQYYDIPNPNSSLSTARQGDIRPFALGSNEGKLYVGLVDSAQSSASTSDLKAYVYSFDPSSNTFGSSAVLSQALNYSRGIAEQGGSLQAEWQPWSDTFSTVTADGTTAVHPQPILADIEFDNGSMILGLRDRLGDQIGESTPNPASSDGSGTLYRIITAGDMLRAAPSSSTPGSFVVENNGSVADGFGGTLNNNTAVDQPEAPDNEQGIGGEEFYTGDPYIDYHDEAAIGSLAQLPGATDVVGTFFDPIYDVGTSGASDAFNGAFTAGVRRLSNIDGAIDNTTAASDQYQVYDGDTFTQPNDEFGKINGLGDLEILTDNAPIVIGNRIWTDTDNDGIQDAGEDGISGVTVNLYNSSGTKVGTTTTNSSGEYYLNDANVTLNGASGLVSFTTYSIRLDNSSDYLTGGSLNGKNISLNNQGSNDELDSDAIVSSGYARITITTEDYGENNHSYDFGITSTSKDYGDAPDGTSGNGAGNYTTTSANSGASHTIVTNLSIGSTLDADSGTLQNTAATADDIDGSDDEDGITSFSTFKTDDSSYSVSVSVYNNNATANLIGWIDFNQDGIFQSTEAASTSVTTSSTLQSKTLTWGVASLRDGLELMKKFLFQRSRIFKEYELSKM
jgi:hypothetical protein